MALFNPKTVRALMLLSSAKNDYTEHSLFLAIYTFSYLVGKAFFHLLLIKASVTEKWHPLFYCTYFLAGRSLLQQNVTMFTYNKHSN